MTARYPAAWQRADVDGDPLAGCRAAVVACALMSLATLVAVAGVVVWLTWR